MCIYTYLYTHTLDIECPTYRAVHVYRVVCIYRCRVTYTHIYIHKCICRCRAPYTHIYIHKTLYTCTSLSISIDIESHTHREVRTIRITHTLSRVCVCVCVHIEECTREHFSPITQPHTISRYSREPYAQRGMHIPYSIHIECHTYVYIHISIHTHTRYRVPYVYRTNTHREVCTFPIHHQSHSLFYLCCILSHRGMLAIV